MRITIVGILNQKKDDIVLFKNKVEISDEISIRNSFLPTGKKLGKMGYNYMHYDSVIRILDAASNLNPNDKIISRIKKHFLTDTKYKQ